MALQPGTDASNVNTSPEQLARREVAAQELVAPRPTVPLAALLSGQRWRFTARWIGLAIFCVGAGMLAWVFYQAMSGFQNFSKPDYFSLQFNRVAGDQVMDRVQAMVAVFAAELYRVLYLLLLGFLGSAIATKGIQFFSASEAVIDEAVAAGIEE